MKKLINETMEFLREKVENLEREIFASVVNNYNTIATPEDVTPLSKLHAMRPSSIGQNIKLTLGGQLTAKGRDLVYVLGKENFKTAIMGG